METERRKKAGPASSLGDDTRATGEGGIKSGATLVSLGMKGHARWVSRPFGRIETSSTSPGRMAR